MTEQIYKQSRLFCLDNFMWKTVLFVYSLAKVISFGDVLRHKKIFNSVKHIAQTHTFEEKKEQKRQKGKLNKQRSAVATIHN